MPNGKETLTVRVSRLEERDKSDKERNVDVAADIKEIKKTLNQVFDRLNQLPCKQDALRLENLEKANETAITERKELMNFKNNLLGKWGVVAVIAIAATTAALSAVINLATQQ